VRVSMYMYTYLEAVFQFSIKVLEVSALMKYQLCLSPHLLF